MAQTGFTPLIHYNSGTTGHVPSSVNLVAGEIAINYFDGSLFYLDNTSTVQRFGGITQTAGVTGAGANVLATSPVLVTPNLGTPSALVATNVTGTAAELSIGGNAATATNVAYSGLTGTVPTWNQNTTGTAATATLATTATTATTANALNPANTYSVSGMNGGQLAGLRNRIINGDMRIAQRGTSLTLTTAVQYTVDRWASYVTGGTAAATASQVASGLTGAQYALKLQRTAGSTNTNTIVAASALESLDSIPIAGKTVAISFFAKAGANYSPSSSYLGLALTTGTGTDQTVGGIYAGIWTGWVPEIDTYTTLTTAFQHFSFTATIPPGATQIGFAAWMVPTGTAGADDSFYITGVQLEVADPVNPVATPFEQIPVGLDLDLCRRYYRVYATSQNTGDLAYQMRTTPTAAGAGPYTYSAEL